MTQSTSRDEIALYVMGAYDGDVAALEARIADDAAARAMLAEEAELELSLRDAAAMGTFCPSCDDLVADATEPVRCVSCGAAVNPGGYRIERVLVANAHGRMYVARDADGTQVALKELAFVQSPSMETVAAFEREAKFLRALEHPAIPRFRAAFEEGTGVHTRYYLAQELVDGTALDTRLDDHFYSEAEIIEIARQVLGVLVYLQGLSPMVIHRDIKPANLLRRPDGTIAVVDFGAAHVQGTTAGSTSIGTFGYMPLEQLAGQVDATTDLYALGASLVHLLTRREPWRVFGPATFESINVSPALQQFLAKCVAPEPKHRFPNAAAALDGLDSSAVAVAAPRASRVPRNAWKVGIGILAAALTLSGAGIAGYHLRGARTESTPVAPPSAGEAPKTRAAIIEQTAKSAAERERIDEMLLHHGAMHEEPRPPIPAPVRFTSTSKVDLDFKAAPLQVVLGTIRSACGVNVVFPSHLRATVTVKATDTPCSEMFEALLESHGLDYVFDPHANLVRIAPRKELAHDREDAVERAAVYLRTPHTTLPTGPIVELDFKDTELRKVLDILANANDVNLVMPEHIRGQVSIMGTQMPWPAALEGVLASQGLWYRYRPEGRILRIAPRKELDHEDRETHVHD